MNDVDAPSGTVRDEKTGEQVCANCGMPIVPAEVGWVHVPRDWLVDCKNPSPTLTVRDETTEKWAP